MTAVDLAGALGAGAAPELALTVRQPWAGLVVAGIKPVENRGWRPAYRGDIWLHAGTGADPIAEWMDPHLVHAEAAAGPQIWARVAVLGVEATGRDVTKAPVIAAGRGECLGNGTGRWRRNGFSRNPSRRGGAGSCGASRRASSRAPDKPNERRGHKEMTTDQ